MIHAGQHTGSWLGHIFQEAYYSAWCDAYARVADLAIRLAGLHVDQWLDVRQKYDVMCDTCHNTEEFDIEPVEAGPLRIAEYTCQVCGRSMHLDLDQLGRRN